MWPTSPGDLGTLERLTTGRHLPQLDQLDSPDRSRFRLHPNCGGGLNLWELQPCECCTRPTPLLQFLPQNTAFPSGSLEHHSVRVGCSCVWPWRKVTDCCHLSVCSVLIGWDDEVGDTHKTRQGEGGEQGDALMPFRTASCKQNNGKMFGGRRAFVCISGRSVRDFPTK